MIIEAAAFTDRGLELVQRIRDEILPEEECRVSRPGKSHREWTKQAFENADALIFVGAAGIAVRSIAPFIQRKDQDPAVIVMDEGGRFVIPLLSGHIGGANELAEKIAKRLGAICVTTTATDVNGLFAVDVWAKKQGLFITDISRIKNVSGKLLRGETVFCESEFEIKGTAPAMVELLQEQKNEGKETSCEMMENRISPDFRLTVHAHTDQALDLVPRTLMLGIGCKRDTPEEKIEHLFEKVFKENNLYKEAVIGVSSIDVKANEEGLISFCKRHGFSFTTFSAEELKNVQGEFHGSGFVSQTVGVDNVCERSAVCGCQGNLLISKAAEDGVTMAVAEKLYEAEWK